jgi:hypothetical protein
LLRVERELDKLIAPSSPIRFNTKFNVSEVRLDKIERAFDKSFIPLIYFLNELNLRYIHLYGIIDIIYKIFLQSHAQFNYIYNHISFSFIVNKITNEREIENFILTKYRNNENITLEILEELKKLPQNDLIRELLKIINICLDLDSKKLDENYLPNKFVAILQRATIRPSPPPPPPPPPRHLLPPKPSALQAAHGGSLYFGGSIDYKQKYLKYKQKYLNLKNNL